MADRPSRRWIPVASTIALAAVLLIAAILILPIPGKTTTTTGATATIATSLQTTSAALSTTGATTTTSVTSLQTSLTTLTTSDYNSSLGLELSMSIAGSALSENDGVSLYLSLDNTLATRNNLTRPGGRDLPLSSYQTCSQLPVGVEIFQGNYDVGNASQGEPLGLIGSNEVVHCAVMPDSWSLAPMSNHITYPTGPAAPASMNVTYWGNWSYSGQVFRPFSPGTYTIEGLDFWGQATILHFQVVENQNPLDCATIASNSSFAAYTNGSAGPGPLKLDAYYWNPGRDNTVVLALTYAGSSTLIPYITAYWGFSLHYYEPFVFSPNMSQTDAWRYYSPNGTLGYPAFFSRDQCVLLSATFSLHSPQTTLTLGFSDNQTQTFTVNP